MNDETVSRKLPNRIPVYESGEVSEDTLREKPLRVPWTWGEYYAVRYLAAPRGETLDVIGAEALRRGLREMAREAIAAHINRGKPVPQRLALIAQGEIKQSGRAHPAQPPRL